MKDGPCYVLGDHPADGYSAYCAEHKPKMPAWRAELNGRKQSQCGQCHEVFSTPRWFDLHQSLREGKLTCKDPRRMFQKETHRRLMVLTTRGWARNPDLNEFNTFERINR